MIVAVLVLCTVINLMAIVATWGVRDFPSPGGKVLNTLIHLFGAACGAALLNSDI